MTLDWIPPEPTSYDLDYADLTRLDLSKFDTPEGKTTLVRELKEAVSKDGFWTIVNHGISEEEVTRQFVLAKHFFDSPIEDKKAKECDFTKGNYLGYKETHKKEMFGTRVKESMEVFNIPKFNGQYEEYYKQSIYKFRDEIESFQKKSYEVGVKILKLFALILEIDENYFVNQHKFEDNSDDHLRYMKYTIRPEEDDKLVENIYARGHTDFGSLTLLFEQRVAGLQIKLSNGEWKYVKPIKNSIVCNIGDALTFWSNGYFKSTIHRVVRPPPDQVHRPRHGLFYFFRPGDNSLIKVVDSPLLRELGLYKESQPIVGTDYVRQRTAHYHNRAEYPKQDNVKFKVGQYEITDGFN